MTRSYRIVNTGNWADEPFEVLFGGSQVGKLLVDSGGMTDELVISDKTRSVAIRPVQGRAPEAPVHDEDGTQLFPRVEARWLPHGGPSWEETERMLVKARDENRRLEQRVSDLKAANERLRAERDGLADARRLRDENEALAEMNVEMGRSLQKIREVVLE